MTAPRLNVKYRVGAETDQSRAGDGANGEPAPARRTRTSSTIAIGRHDPERVPVADGGSKPVPGDRVERPESFREQPREQAVEGDRGERDRYGADERRHRTPPYEQERGGQRERVDEVALNLGQRMAGSVRPDAGQRDPADVRRQRGDSSQLEPAKTRRREQQRERATQASATPVQPHVVGK